MLALARETVKATHRLEISVTEGQALDQKSRLPILLRRNP
jgi:hypothetical protein